jgi:hypothetical protein
MSTKRDPSRSAASGPAVEVGTAASEGVEAAVDVLAEVGAAGAVPAVEVAAAGTVANPAGKLSNSEEF